MVQEKKEQNAHPEADKGREKGPPSLIRRLVDGGNDQAPDGRRNHYAGGKPGQGPLDVCFQIFLQKEYTGSSGRCTHKGNQKSQSKRGALNLRSRF